MPAPADANEIGSRRRLSGAPRDVVNGLRIARQSFTTRADPPHALDIPPFKLEVLWTMLDAVWMAYIEKKAAYRKLAAAGR